ncbi:MAG: HAMP domain-containing histidine kinase [Acidobacteria bacterium]|nr:HAMP domain-containing histidine kinase [Acidobacteriota bacterium]
MLERLSIRQKFRLLSIIALASFCCAAALVWSTLYSVKVNGPLYARIVDSQNLVADVLPPPGNLLEPYLVALQLRHDPSSRDYKQIRREFSRLHAEFIATERRWVKVEFPAQILREKQEADSDAKRFFSVAIDSYLPALERGDTTAADVSLSQMNHAYIDQRAHLQQLVQSARAYNIETEHAASKHIFVMSVLLAAVGLLAIAAYTSALRRVENSIANPIDELLGIIRKVLTGDWRIDPAARANDREAGELLVAIRQIVETTQAELVKAQKMAALGLLVAGISHELSTPVGNSLMAVSTVDGELQRFRADAEKVLKRSALVHFVDAVEFGVAIAQRNLERTAELLRSFKQVAVDRTTSQRRKFFVEHAISDTLALLQPRINRKGCLVVADIEPSIEMDSYPGPFGQVLTNLIENAINHGLEGEEGGVLEIRVETAAPHRVRVIIKDNGCGIADGDRAHIFDPFFTTKMGHGGTGLGLHIVHNIVYDLLGGTITVRSTPQSGSEFELLLPLAAPAMGPKEDSSLGEFNYASQLAH